MQLDWALKEQPMDSPKTHNNTMFCLGNSDGGMKPDNPPRLPDLRETVTNIDCLSTCVSAD